MQEQQNNKKRKSGGLGNGFGSRSFFLCRLRFERKVNDVRLALLNISLQGASAVVDRRDWIPPSRTRGRVGGSFDPDGDGDNDVVLISMANDWSDPDNASVVWLENDGRQTFATRQVATAPIHLVTVATGDLNGDNRPDIIAGSLNLRSPFERIGGVTGWLNRGPAP